LYNLEIKNQEKLNEKKENWKRKRKWKFTSRTVGVKLILANDSEIRIMASSWRIVIGIEDLSFNSSSFPLTSARIVTKWLLNFSAASFERRGAHFLFFYLFFDFQKRKLQSEIKIKRKFTIYNKKYIFSLIELEYLQLQDQQVFQSYEHLRHGERVSWKIMIEVS